MYVPLLHVQDPLVSRVGMATLSTRTMDVFDFVGVVEVPAIVSVVDEHFHYYPHIYHPSVTGVTQFLTATLLKSTLFISVCGTTETSVFQLLLMMCALYCKAPSNCMMLGHQTVLYMYWAFTL